MSIALVVLVSGLLVGGLLVVSSRMRRRPGVLDPERAEHWLIARVQHRPRLVRALRAADRSIVGGGAVAVSLAAVWLAALAVGWILDTVDTNAGFARWDQAVAQWGGEHATAVSTDVLRGLTHLGDTTVVLAAMVVVALIDQHRHRDPAVFGFLATVGIGVVVLNNVLKLLVERERPPVEHLAGSSGFSFPSGHSAAAAACWAAIALIMQRSLPRRLRPVVVGGAAAVAFLVAASRALLGVHWLTDVVAGVIVGWAWFFLVAIVFGGRIQRFGDPVAVVGEHTRRAPAPVTAAGFEIGATGKPGPTRSGERNRRTDSHDEDRSTRSPREGAR